MFSTLFLHLASYWLAWTNLFPSMPLWSPHGAVMTPIVAAAALVLGGKYLMAVVNRT
jgi:hypothetical protein